MQEFLSRCAVEDEVVFSSDQLSITHDGPSGPVPEVDEETRAYLLLDGNHRRAVQEHLHVRPTYRLVLDSSARPIGSMPGLSYDSPEATACSSDSDSMPSLLSSSASDESAWSESDPATTATCKGRELRKETH